MPPSPHHSLTASSSQLSAENSNLRSFSHTPTDAGLGFFMIFRTSSPSEQCLPTPTQQDAALFSDLMRLLNRCWMHLCDSECKMRQKIRWVIWFPTICYSPTGTFLWAGLSSWSQTVMFLVTIVFIVVIVVGIPPGAACSVNTSRHWTSVGGVTVGVGGGYPAIKRWAAKFLLNFVLLQYTLVKEAGCSEHAVFKCFYSHALLDCVGCGGDSQSQVSNSCHLRHLGWGGREALDVRY